MADNAANGCKLKRSLGFLTVLECPRDGLFGGYLLLNCLGRPVEFHCTAPIKPNRAQQILYGPTLDSYLYGEQIGYSLIKGASHSPLAVFTDHSAVLAVRELVELPVAYVEAVEAREAGRASSVDASGPVEPKAAGVSSDAGGKTWRVHGAHLSAAAFRHFHWGQNRLAASPRAEEDEAVILERLAELTDSFDLSEPFVRIHEAIAEARGSGDD